MVIQPATHSATQPGAETTVKRMAGMLWYEMLSALDETGFSKDALGTGGSDFQSMFLWQIAENDFGKYDKGLVNAALRQMGVGQGAAPSPQPAPGTRLIEQAQAATPAIEAQPLSTPSDLLAQAMDFVKSIWPQVSAVAAKLGVPPIGVLAQAALETGWGKAVPGNNLFGIKAGDGQQGTMRATQEMVNGAMVPQAAPFRDYASMGDSVADYGDQLLTGFQNVLGQNSVSGFANALQASGYATDNAYAAKIISISQSPLMSQVLQSMGVNDLSSTAGGL